MNKHVRSIAIAVALAGATSWSWQSLLAETGRPMVDQVRVGENRQMQIKGDTQRAAEELGGIIQEFEKNGLGDGADVQILKAIKSVLGKLSDKEMAKVIALLQAARNTNDNMQATRNVVDAVGTQKNIMVQMRQLLLEYQRQQALIELSLQFGQLAEQQQKNMKATRTLSKSVKGISLKNYDEPQKTSLQLQQSTQAGINEVATAQLAKLVSLAKELDEATAEKLNRVIEAANAAKLSDVLNKAGEDLNQGNLFSAGLRERIARDKLRELSKLVAPNKEPIAILREAVETLTTAINEQKFVIENTKALAGVDLQKNAADLEDRQADLIDGTDILRKDLGDLAPGATSELKTAQDKMQEARQALGGAKKEPATDRETEALARLEAAKDQLVTQLTRLEKEAANPDALAQAKKLKEQITALRMDEEQLKKETNGKKDAAALSPLATRQGTLLQKARDLQILSATEAPQASQALSDAAKEMDGAQIALGSKMNSDDALKSEQRAIDALLKAEQAMDEQIASLEKAKEDLAKLEKAREEVAKAIEKEQKIEIATAKLAAKEEKKEEAKKDDAKADPKKDEAKNDQKKDEAKNDAKKDDPKKDDAQADAKNDANKNEAKADDAKKDDAKQAEDLAKEQADVAKNTEEAKKGLEEASKDATKALDDAGKDMQGAKADLDKNDPKKANPEAKDALADLNKAKNAMDQKIEDLQKQLGQTQDNTAKLEEIAKALAEAQANLNNAMENKPDEQAGKEMEQVANDVTKAAAEDKGALPENAENAIKAATEALSKAAAAEAKANTPEAKAQAKEAQKELAKAQAAVAMAQSGMQPGQEKADQQGPQKPEQGKKPGQKPMKADENAPKEAKGERKDDKSNAGSEVAGTGNKGGSGYLALPAREREAILQDRKEKYPEEYGTMIERYLKNLSDNER